MGPIVEHLRNKFVAGILAAVPIAIVVYAAIWIEAHTRELSAPLGIHFPGLGFVIAVVGVYLLGLLVTSVLGRWLIGLVNGILKKVPGLNMLYQGWKDLLIVSPERAGMYHQAVLVSTGGQCGQVGFTSGEPLPGDPESICVLLPNIPSPFSGRLIVVPRSACVPLKLSSNEAVKFQLSSGNYLPSDLVGLNKEKPPKG